MSDGPHPSTRLPRAGVDPITDDGGALALLRLAANPHRCETILVLLDDRRRGLGLVVVSDTTDADAVVDVANRLLDPVVHDGRVAAVIVASVRTPHARDGIDLTDADRWLGLDDVAAHHGVELVEWYVLDDGVSRPRELLNAPPRWSARPRS